MLDVSESVYDVVEVVVAVLNRGKTSDVAGALLRVDVAELVPKVVAVVDSVMAVLMRGAVMVVMAVSGSILPIRLPVSSVK